MTGGLRYCLPFVIVDGTVEDNNTWSQWSGSVAGVGKHNAIEPISTNRCSFSWWNCSSVRVGVSRLNYSITLYFFDFKYAILIPDYKYLRIVITIVGIQIYYTHNYITLITNKHCFVKYYKMCIVYLYIFRFQEDEIIAYLDCRWVTTEKLMQNSYASSPEYDTEDVFEESLTVCISYRINS